MADLKVTAYRGKRNYHLDIADYSKVIRDVPGEPPARERAEQLTRELAERSHRNRLGWTHMRITPMARNEAAQ